jgi:Uma2 family endonuclease
VEPTARITTIRATLDDLARAEGKAELIGGRIVHLPAMGHRPGQATLRIAESLMSYAQTAGRGVVHTHCMVFAVPELPSGRESFSACVSYYVGPLPSDEMDFIHGAPTFAVEIRSKNDYGPAADLQATEKRSDYFQAGTNVVWDVDPIAKTVKVYRGDHPDHPAVFVRGMEADAEPAVPGWRLAVDRIFS